MSLLVEKKPMNQWTLLLLEDIFQACLSCQARQSVVEISRSEAFRVSRRSKEKAKKIRRDVNSSSCSSYTV